MFVEDILLERQVDRVQAQKLAAVGADSKVSYVLLPDISGPPKRRFSVVFGPYKCVCRGSVEHVMLLDCSAFIHRGLVRGDM